MVMARTGSVVRKLVEEETNFWHDAVLGDLELLHATYVTHAFAPHIHEGYAIGVIERGAEQFAYRGAQHVAGAGSIVIINPAEVHTGQAAADHGWTYRMLYPAADQLRLAAAQLIGKPADYPFFAHAVVADAALAQQLRELHIHLEAGIEPLARETLWLTLLTELIARHADRRYSLPSPYPTADRVTVQQALDYLHAHYANPIGLDDLAALTHLSPYHFLRLFKAEVGMPPHTYLTQLRIQQAKALLNRGQPIAEVAQQVGFTDQSHLARHFKRVVGVTPGQYRAG
jgi:AraC-like DNA-binding protein